MKLRHHLRVVPMAMSLGIKQAMATKIDLLGSAIIYFTIMVVWSGIMKMIPLTDIAKYNWTHSDLIWYLCATEYVLFAVQSWGFKEVQSDHISELIHLSLLRPYPDSLLRISMWGGESVVRSLVMLPVFIGCGYFFAGPLPVSWLNIVGLMLGMPCSSVMLLIAVYAVGSSCLWFLQSEPAFWIWQKCVFLFGAMIWPMAFYPEAMQTIMWFTPFPGILANAGDWILGQGMFAAFAHFVHQLFWVLIFLFALGKLDRLVLKHIQKGGG